MKCGCVLIKFRDGISDDTIQNVINGVYHNNVNDIDGMEFYQFDNEEPLSEFAELVKSMKTDTRKEMSKQASLVE